MYYTLVQYQQSGNLILNIAFAIAKKYFKKLNKYKNVYHLKNKLVYNFDVFQ